VIKFGERFKDVNITCLIRAIVCLVTAVLLRPSLFPGLSCRRRKICRVFKLFGGNFLHAVKLCDVEYFVWQIAGLI
jgi:hypothetical protein